MQQTQWVRNKPPCMTCLLHPLRLMQVTRSEVTAFCFKNYHRLTLLHFQQNVSQSISVLEIIQTKAFGSSKTDERAADGPQNRSQPKPFHSTPLAENLFC